LTRDFTLEMYSELVCALKENYNIMSVSDYLTTPMGDAPICVLLPDVLLFNWADTVCQISGCEWSLHFHPPPINPYYTK